MLKASRRWCYKFADDAIRGEIVDHTPLNGTTEGAFQKQARVLGQVWRPVGARLYQHRL